MRHISCWDDYPLEMVAIVRSGQPVDKKESHGMHYLDSISLYKKAWGKAQIKTLVICDGPVPLTICPFVFRVYAMYNSVKGSCSEPVSFTTHSCAPECPFPPKLAHRSKSSLTLQWKVGSSKCREQCEI